METRKAMEAWKATAGIILLIVGLLVAWQGYTTINHCNSVGGRISVAVTSLFGGTQAQACYNAQIIEVGGVIIALVGLVVAASAYMKSKRR
jgi:multisubunit Na+/H+ antiporter MnhB subunit